MFIIEFKYTITNAQRVKNLWTTNNHSHNCVECLCARWRFPFTGTKRSTTNMFQQDEAQSEVHDGAVSQDWGGRTAQSPDLNDSALEVEWTQTNSHVPIFRMNLECVVQ